TLGRLPSEQRAQQGAQPVSAFGRPGAFAVVVWVRCTGHRRTPIEPQLWPASQRRGCLVAVRTSRTASTTRHYCAASKPQARAVGPQCFFGREIHAPSRTAPTPITAGASTATKSTNTSMLLGVQASNEMAQSHICWARRLQPRRN